VDEVGDLFESIREVIDRHIRGDHSARVPVMADEGTEAGLASSVNELLDDFDRKLRLRDHREAQLRLSGERLAESQRLARLGSWEWTLGTGVLRWSDETLRLFGYAPGAITPSFDDYLNHLHPDNRGTVKSWIEGAIEGRQPFSHQQRIVRADGEERVLAVRGQLTEDDEGRPLALGGTMYDVTDIERAKQIVRRDFDLVLLRLARSPELSGGPLNRAFETISEASGIALEVERSAVWLVDEAHESIICVDQFIASDGLHSSGLELFKNEYPRYFEELETSRNLALDDAQNDPRSAEFVDGYLAPLGISSMLDAPVRIGQRLVGVVCYEHVGPMRSWSSEEMAFVASIADVVAQAVELAERRQAEEALRASEARYRALIEQLPAATYVSAAGSVGAVIYLSPQAEGMLGIDRARLLSSHGPVWALGIHEDDRERVERAWTTSRELSRPLRVTYRSLSHGQLHWIRDEAVPILHEDGQIAFWQGVLLDVTEQERAKTETEARRAAEAANQAKTDFLANMSHELRTPLNGILGMASLLKDSKLDLMQRQQLSGIDVASRRLSRLVADLLDFAKLGAGSMQLRTAGFDLREAFTELEESFRVKAASKRLVLIVEVDSRVPSTVQGDRDRLVQVLVNLVENGIKFTDRGSVRIALRVLADESLSFVVSDTGCGIPSEQRARIFQRFERLDSARSASIPGSGLGLAICQQLVTLMGGEIRCDAVSGGGTSFGFVIKLPEVAAPKRRRRTTRSTISRGFVGVRILLAEDDRLSREVARLMLERQGCDVRAVSDGHEAVAAFVGGTYDLVFMDCQMPVLDGYDATRQIREAEQQSTSRVPIVALTAHALDSDRHKALSCGMDNYLAKPVEAAQLIDMIQRYVTKSEERC
jgi:PAS domain S-box-containing protein